MNKYPLWFFTDIFLCIKFCLFPLSKVLHFYRKISLVLSLFQVWVDLVRINNEFSTNNLSTLVPAGPPKKQELWDTHQWIVDTGTKRRVPKCRMEQMSHSFQPPMNHHQTNGQDCQPSIATAYSIVPRHYILKLILVQCVHTHTLYSSTLLSTDILGPDLIVSAHSLSFRCWKQFCFLSKPEASPTENFWNPGFGKVKFQPNKPWRLKYWIGAFWETQGFQVNCQPIQMTTSWFSLN